MHTKKLDEALAPQRLLSILRKLSSRIIACETDRWPSG